MDDKTKKIISETETEIRKKLSEKAAQFREKEKIYP